MDAAAAQGVLGDLKRAIDEIYKKNASTLSFEELYRCEKRAKTRRRKPLK